MKGKIQLLSILAVVFASNICAQGKNPPELKTQFGKIKIFPKTNPWNQEVSKLKVHPNSANFIASPKKTLLA